MGRRPFLVRVLVPFVGLWAAVSAATLGLSLWAARGSVYADQVRAVNAAVAAVRRGGADGELRSLARAHACRLTVIAGDGRVLFDTDADPATMPNHNDRPEVAEARRTGLGTATRSSETIRHRAVYLAEPVTVGDEVRVARVCYVHPAWESPPTPLWAVAVGGAALTAVTFAGLGVVLQRQWVGPIRSVADAAHRLAMGQWDARVDPRGSNDVRTLGVQVNTMAAQAELQLAELKRQRRDLRSLVDALPDPILVTDVIGRVELVNVPAADLLELSPSRVAGHQAVAVINDEALLRALESGGEVAASWETRPVYQEVRLDRDHHRRTYQSFSARTATGGSMLVLRDVTAMADAVQMKTDFVANASHELRTPIAAIKIAMETLREAAIDDPPQADRCVNIIDGHVTRLEDLLRDLLDLSRLESPEAKPTLGDTTPWELFAAVRSAFGPTAKRKGVDLRFGEGDGLVTPDSFRSDEHLLNLVLKNLVENSLKFTPAGGTVTVSLGAVETEAGRPAVQVSVADTGIGIPPEHRDRVFERFYQVDPARSGTAGRGTGLGLAIVKHAVAALGGTLRLESEVGRGTSVTCVLPQADPPPPAAGRPSTTAALVR